MSCTPPPDHDHDPRPFGLPPGPALDAAVLAEQHRFSLHTFGPGARAEGVVAHIRKELEEVLRAPGDLSEWVDVMILAADGAMRAGHSPADLVAGYRAKLERNFARTWPDWRGMPADQPIEHDRAADALVCEETPVAYGATNSTPDEVCTKCDGAGRVWRHEFGAVLSVTVEDGEVEA